MINEKAPTIYLDNASTTMIDPEVLEAMLPYLKSEYGNAGNIHHLGRRAAEAVEKARVQVASVFDCSPKNIIFTSGGSESNNLAIKGIKDYLIKKNKRHIITSEIEHDSVLKAVSSLIKEEFYISYVKPEISGVVSPRLIGNQITDETGLIILMHANNEIGSVNNIKAVGDICRSKNILFHSDYAQTAGRIKIDTVFTTASISSHKIHGCKGAGALYVKEGISLSPLISGGNAQEFGVRGGTENVAGIVGFGKACELEVNNIRQNKKKIYSLRVDFIGSLNKNLGTTQLSEAGIYMNGGDFMGGKILNLRIDGVSSETLMLMLDSKGVCASAGSACRAHESEPSHVLTAIGLTPDEARSSIRISFSKFNTKDEVVRAAKILASCIETLRRMGGAYSDG